MKGKELDIYQIFITYNPAWTRREIICFSVLCLLAALWAGYLLWHKKILLSQAVSGMLLLIFLGIVFGSTVFARQPKDYREYRLELFWSWKEVFHGDRELLKENLLNILLLFPVGFLLPSLFHKKLSWWSGLLAGLIISAGIEIGQLVLCRGLFEWDDMVHNSLGCMLGLLCGNAEIDIWSQLIKKFRRKRQG